MKARLVRIAISMLLVLGVGMLAVPVPTQSAPPAEITLDPTPVEVETGEPFEVTLKIEGIPEPGMAAYDFWITFTPGVIQFATSVGDHEWPDPNYGTPFVFTVDNVAGRISFNDIYTAIPAPSGDITLAVLHGTAIATESVSTDLHFDKSDIKDPDGADIPATVTDGEVRVWVTPVASFTWNYTDANNSGTLDAGEEIQFTDTSTNMPTSWHWDFDDGNFSSDQHPTHLYTTAGTYSVTLTATNPANSDSAIDDVTVEPNSLAEVVVSPHPATVLISSSIIFNAAGYDEYDNPIPGIVWTWEVTNPVAGMIDAGSGEFIAGDTPGIYADVIKATGTYKEATISGYATVEVVSWLAGIGLTKGLGDDGVALAGARIINVYDPATGDPVEGRSGVAGYGAKASYDGSLVNILGVRGGEPPFDAAPTYDIDDVAGQATFTAGQTTDAPQPPLTVAQIAIRLVGSVYDEAELELSFSHVTDGEGTLIPEDKPDIQTFRRGDARADGEVNIADALYVAQYLAGVREVGHGLNKVHPVNSASAKWDDDGDVIDISDVLYIAQYLAGLRDAHFNWAG